MAEKRCFKCGHIKPIVEFYRHAKMADGHLNKCKSCARLDVHQHRHGSGRDRVVAYDRERASLPHRIENAKRAYAKWKAVYPDRRSAQITLGNAVRDGRIIPQPCLICGAKAEAHHPDYSAPLEVVWLCPAHHKQAHALKKISVHNQNA